MGRLVALGGIGKSCTLGQCIRVEMGVSPLDKTKILKSTILMYLLQSGAWLLCHEV